MLPDTFMFQSLLPLLLVSFSASLVAALRFNLTTQQMSCRPILTSSRLLQHVFTCLFFTSIQYKLIIIYFLQAHWLTTNCVDSTISLFSCHLVDFQFLLLLKCWRCLLHFVNLLIYSGHLSPSSSFV